MLAGVSLARMEGHIPSGLNGVVRWSQTWSIKALDPMLSLNSTYSSGPTTKRVVSEDMASAQWSRASSGGGLSMASTAGGAAGDDCRAGVVAVGERRCCVCATGSNVLHDEVHPLPGPRSC